MSDDLEAKVRALAPAKALAMAGYGESVAAYRYRMLAEKTTDETLVAVFVEMAEEEKGHHAMVEKLLTDRHPGADFVLSQEDKEMVTVGQRMLDVNDKASFDRAMELLVDSEHRTGRFYTALHACTDDPQLKSVFREMADECVEHAHRLETLPGTN